MKKRAEFPTVCFIADSARSPSNIIIETTGLTDAQGIPILRMVVGKVEVWVRASDLAEVARTFHETRKT